MLDYLIVSLSRQNGQGTIEPSAVLAAQPPKRASRSRSDDRLLLMLTFQGASPWSDIQQKQLLEKLAKGYFKINGSVTLALRIVAEQLNNFLIQHNLKLAGQGKQLSASLQMAVLRKQQLTIGQCGSMHAYLCDEQHFGDKETAPRGLGVSKALDIRYFRADLHPGDRFLLSSQPVSGWRKLLTERFNLPASELKQQLFNQIPENCVVMSIQCQPGSGLVQRKTARSAPSPVQEEATRQAPVQTASSLPLPVVPHDIPVSTRSSSLLQKPDQTIGDEKAKPAKRPSWGPLVWSSFSAIRRAIHTTLSAGMRFLARTLPEEHLGTLPKSIMAGVAVVIPLILVTIASMVVSNRSQAIHYQQYMQLAQTAAEQAMSATDLAEIHVAWENTLINLDQAESYHSTPESQALRELAQNTLDQMDGVIRLDFQPIISGGLLPDSNITRLIASRDDLYLLDSAHGAVYRAWRTGSGYDIDPNFLCAAGQYGHINVGPPVDMVPLPIGNEWKAAILAMDANGNVLYCGSGEQPFARTFFPPDEALGYVQAIDLNLSNLYLLDPGGNAVWVYPGKNGSFDAPPRFYFDEQVPPLKDAVDIMATHSDFFALYQDGHIATCVESVEKVTCTNQATYVDGRDGRQNSAVIADAQFSQIFYSTPPDPSLFLLDAQHQAIYHFSLKLVFQEQFRSSIPRFSDTPATAFTLSPDGMVFIALGNTVYVAPRP